MMTLLQLHQRLFTSFVLTALLLTTRTQAQLQCTLSAMDESSCIESTADGGDHCVWCALTSFGFCVSESQAEAMEQQIPGIHCDRYSNTDDDATNTDDDATSTDDAVTPTDDEIPDNFWTCLANKDAKSCVAADCTWCDSKAGFGLCMTGPTADSASESDWFTCSSSSLDSTTTSTVVTTDTMKSPYDPTCMMVTLLTPNNDDDTGNDETRCVSTLDMTGNACEWCDLAGQAKLCLTAEQAEMGAPLGVACQQQLEQQQPQDPMDPSCALAFLQDQTKEGCLAASDQDGNQCEFCTLQGAITLCLTEEQAEYGEAMGIECEKSIKKDQAKDPLDTSCALAFLQDQTKEGCESAQDQDGRACEWCALPSGAGNICLNTDQADIAEQLGVTCDAAVGHQKLRGSLIE